MKSIKKYSRQVFAAVFAVLVCISSFACEESEESPTLPTYAPQDFVTFGFWSPYELTEESFTLHKQSGLNTMFFGNHSLRPWSSDNLHYLGSNATQLSFELCRKVGLKALPSYGEWYHYNVEGKQYSKTPFSDYDLYGEYKDIIVGMHIADEPSFEALDKYGNDELTADYKSVYDVPYMVNLLPNYADSSRIGKQGYKHYVETYAEKIVQDFENNRLMSVDFYPFRSEGLHSSWLLCYNDMANVAKRINSQKSYYIQTAVKNEFQDTLGQDEIRMQLDVAMAFGADWFGFYCYAVPKKEQGDWLEPMYEYCMLNPDGTPSPLYYAVQGELARISSFSSVYLAYDWVKTVPVAKDGGRGGQALRLLGNIDFTDTAIKQVKTSEDVIVGCFDSEKGEAFMLVNYGNPSDKKNATVEMEFSKGKYAAIYGINNELQIVKLDDGKLSVMLPTGHGCFVTLL
jgi:hypothetical protein